MNSGFARMIDANTTLATACQVVGGFGIWLSWDLLQTFLLRPSPEAHERGGSLGDLLYNSNVPPSPSF